MTYNIILDGEKKSIWEELKEFWDELVDLLYTDLRNSYLFLTENKNYFMCAVILAILLQFTSVSNLGTSFDKYCNKTINHIKQSGGGEGTPESNASQKVQEYADYKKMKKDQKAQKKADKKAEKEASLTDEQKASKDAKKKGKSLFAAQQSSKNSYKSETKKRQAQEDESKANQKRIGFFENIKNKFGKGSSWGGLYGTLGPVFGNMEKIFDSVKTIFYIAAIILTIVGVLSLPVLIFLIITYMVFKAMIGKFTVL